MRRTPVGGDGEVPEAGALVQGDDGVVEVLEEEEGARLVGGLEVLHGVGPGAPLDADAHVALHDGAHAGLEGGDLLGLQGLVVGEVVEEAGADGHAGHEASLGKELLGGYGEEEAEGAAVGGRALARVQGHRLDAAIGEDLGVEALELVVDQHGGEGPLQAAHLPDDILGLHSRGVCYALSQCVGDRHLPHAGLLIPGLRGEV